MHNLNSVAAKLSAFGKREAALIKALDALAKERCEFLTTAAKSPQAATMGLTDGEAVIEPKEE